MKGYCTVGERVNGSFDIGTKWCILSQALSKIKSGVGDLGHWGLRCLTSLGGTPQQAACSVACTACLCCITSFVLIDLVACQSEEATASRIGALDL